MRRGWLVVVAFLVCGSVSAQPQSVPKTIDDIKKEPLGSQVALTGVVVTTAQTLPTDSFYVHESDHLAGILVVPPGWSTDPPLAATDLVAISGQLLTNGAELYVLGDTVIPELTRGTVGTVGMCNRWLAGGPFGRQPGVVESTCPTKPAVGLSTIGLYVRAWGTVTHADQDFYYIDDGSALDDGSGHAGVRVSGPGPSGAGQFIVTDGVSGARVQTTACGPVVAPVLRPPPITPLEIHIPDLQAEPISSTEVRVKWTTPVDSNSVVEYRDVIPVFREPNWPLHQNGQDYVQAVCYAPEEYGDRLSTTLIDKDLKDIMAANGNAVNLYGLGGYVLDNPIAPESDKTFQQYILDKCRDLQLKVIARIEWYPKEPWQPWTFSFDSCCGVQQAHCDSDAIIEYYDNTFKQFNEEYGDVLEYYVLNLPMDDDDVRRKLWSCPPDYRPYPTAKEQRAYVQYMRDRIAVKHPGAKVRAIVHYSGVDDIPVAPLADLLDGLALLSYPVSCNSTIFPGGLPIVSCSQPALPGDGPALGIDPLQVIIGKDQLDYWINKVVTTNTWPNGIRLAMDGVGFAERVGHWSGIVRNHETKVQACLWLADYLAARGQMDGFSYFMLHDKEEGSWGIVSPPRTPALPTPVKNHGVLLTDLSPGTKYWARVVEGTSHSQWIEFQTPESCPGADWPRLSVTSPGYGGEIAPNPASYPVSGTSNLPEGTIVSLFGSTDDRGLHNIISLGDCTVVPDGHWSRNVDLSSVFSGLHIFATAGATHCSVAGGMLRDFGPGRVVANPVGILDAPKLPDAGPPIVIDGDLSEWSVADFTTFATHPQGSGSSEARVKAAWDADFLYVAFDVSDTEVETTNRPDPNSPDAWDSDSVSIWLWKGTASETRTDLKAFVIESRQGPICECGDQPVGSSRPIYKSACRLEGSTTCNQGGDLDEGFTCEMAIPWDQVHIVPVPGVVISADLLSVDHDANPCQPYNAPETVFSKVHWDSDDEARLGGAIRLLETSLH